MTVAMSTFHWTEAYSVNISLLDKQHQKLFDTVNELDQALRAGQGNAAVEPVLDKLVEYALVHFAAEESLMKRQDFPGLPTHRTQHDVPPDNRFLPRRSQGGQTRCPSVALVLHASLAEATCFENRSSTARF